jgi:tetratricopeptide (TPR) repeat protein
VLLRVLALEPDYAQGHLNLGNAYFARGDVMAARRHYERAADADALRAAALFNLGLCDEQEGRVAEAIAHYEAALERDPNLDAARSRLERLREGGSR